MKGFKEQYLARIFYQKEDGFWERKDVDIWVDFDKYPEAVEKDNHAIAEAIVLEQYPKCRIIWICYC